MPCIHQNARFPIGSCAATKWRKSTPNMSFGPKVVDWACSLRKKKKWFRWHKLMPCIHPDARFPNWSRAATKWCESTPNMSFRPRVVDWACWLQKKEKWFWWHKLMPCIHRNARFPNGSRPATKWRDTTPNMSLGPKVVDWACSLRKKKEMVPVAQTHALYTP